MESILSFHLYIGSEPQTEGARLVESTFMDGATLPMVFCWFVKTGFLYITALAVLELAL